MGIDTFIFGVGFEKLAKSSILFIPSQTVLVFKTFMSTGIIQLSAVLYSLLRNSALN
jgi:hypothetical protein